MYIVPGNIVSDGKAVKYNVKQRKYFRDCNLKKSIFKK